MIFRNVIAVLCFALLSISVSSCRTAQADTIDYIPIGINYQAGLDSTAVNIYWVTPVDGHGDIDSFRLLLGGLVTRDTILSVNQYSFTVLNADTARTLSVSIWSIRNGHSSMQPSIRNWTLPAQNIPPPAPDSISIKSDSLKLQLGFVEPRPLSPHYDHIRRTYTDYCYCWTGTLGELAKAWAAHHYDLTMSGDRDSWKKYNPSIEWIRYALAMSTLDESSKDPDNVTGKYLYDMRDWFSKHPQYSYENAFLHNKDSANADSTSRLNPVIWSSHRYFGNPRDSGWTAYTRDRFLQAWNGDGFFLDEMDHPNLKWIQISKEFADIDTVTAHKIVVSWIKGLREFLDSQRTNDKFILQTNAAGYSKGQFDAAIGEAAQNMHLELMNLATQSQPDVWDFIDGMLAKGVYIDFVGAETWQDMLNPKWITKYPGGNYAVPVYRAKVAQLASYYMVVPSDPQKIGLQIENARFTVRPDSTELEIYEYNVGHPTEARHVIYSSRDSLAQNARIYARHFTNALVLYRPVVSYKDSIFTNNTAVQVPDSITNGYSLIKARGQFVPIEKLYLRNGEAAILISEP